MDRYQNVVKIGLFGHIHSEAITVVKSIKDDKNIGLNYMGGSATTKTNFNPGFTVIEIDEEHMTPVNIKTYSMNLTEANLKGQPNWEFLHDYLNFYQMEDLSPNSFAKIAEKVLVNEEFAKAYIWNKSKKGNDKPKSCDEKCRHSEYCGMISSETF